MTAGKIVNLRVRPQQAANLSLGAGGIIEEMPVTLGQAVVAFDFSGFYGSLSEPSAADPGVLQFDSSGIATALPVTASTLLYLRAESKKAILDAAVSARANAYYGKYANQAAIIAQMKTFYDPASSNAKPQRLSALSMIAESEYDNLQNAYATDGRLGVVKVTTSDLTSTTELTGQATTGTNTLVNEGFASGTQQNSKDAESGSQSGVTPAGQEYLTTSATDKTTGSTTTTGSDHSAAAGQSDTQSSGTECQTQEMTNTDYGYRIPSLEAEAINQRAQVSLIDEQFSQFMFGQNLPYLDQVFTNELNMIDLNVKRLQVAYLDTILLSPIDGTVTAVTRNPGDSVAAGQVLVRVENSASIYLVGTVIYRGMITAGTSTATIGTTAFGEPGSTTTISGTVVAAQGDEIEDDRWDIVVSCSNLDGSGSPIFPLHYGFDYDDTSIVIS